MKLVPTSCLKDMEDIYRIMRLSSFPATPPDFIDAYACLSNSRNYLVKDGDRTVGWVGYHSFSKESCDLDVCILPEYQGKWLTKGILKEMFGRPFIEYGLTDFVIETEIAPLKRSLLDKWSLQELEGRCIFTYKEYERAFLRGKSI